MGPYLVFILVAVGACVLAVIIAKSNTTKDSYNSEQVEPSKTLPPPSAPTTPTAKTESELAAEAAAAAERERQRAIKLKLEAKADLATMEKAFTKFDFGEYIASCQVSAAASEVAAATATAAKPSLVTYLESSDRQRYGQFRILFANFESNVKRHNIDFVERRIKEDWQRFQSIEAYPLTQRQREAIVTDEDTVLVVAGAGTGKTSTIVGKVDYLIRHGLAQPHEIMVMAFNTNAAKELRDRMSSVGIPDSCTAMTFHAFGLKVLGGIQGRSPAISPLAEDERQLQRFTATLLSAMLQDPKRKHHLIEMFSNQLTEPPSDPATSTLPPELLVAEMKSRPRRDLTDKQLKSEQEVKIANWLTLNGIRWDYERVYPHQDDRTGRRVYQPDFYLPDYDIYIEHWGINRQFQTAPFVPNRAYINGMRWKTSQHQRFGTVLVETHSYDDQEGKLIPRLEAQLLALGVATRLLTPAEIDQLLSLKNRQFVKFVALLTQFLSLFKGRVTTQEQVVARATSERDTLFLSIFFDFYRKYEAELSRTGKIDFNDMINKARLELQKGSHLSRFKYVIADEFQDISVNRMGLLQDIRNRTKFGKLFVVGDDWQSIYRFAGSDVSIVTNLESIVGATKRVDLDQAFRYPQSVLDVSSKFIMRNPHQLKKQITSANKTIEPFPICVIAEEADAEDWSGVRVALRDIGNRRIQAKAQQKSCTVKLFGRYNHNLDKQKFEEFSKLGRQINMELEFVTVHRAKGIEADYVILLDVTAGEYGFPSGVSDDPVMSMVMLNKDEFPFAEERRLFYVAITRTKHRTYVVTKRESPSLFIADDLSSSDRSSLVERIGKDSKDYRCPTCNGSTVRRKEGNFGSFWSCANYPLCTGRIAACAHCQDGYLQKVAVTSNLDLYQCSACEAQYDTCPQCAEGALLLKSGIHGPFWGCSQWSHWGGCEFTRNAA